MQDHRPDNASDSDSEHVLLEALYELPLGGPWHDLQQALCSYWLNAADTAPDDLLRLERHFERVMALLERMPPQAHGWRDTLHRVPLPACVFTSTGELADANPQGTQYLATMGLASWVAEHRVQLREVFAATEERAVVSTSLGVGASDTARLYLSRLRGQTSMDPPLYLGVFVAQELPNGALQWLRQDFSLTASEAALCVRLASGGSLDQIASEMDTKRSTLRTHLAHCFEKLNVHSQAELVAMVLQHLFAATYAQPMDANPPTLTAFLDPEIHGHPLFRTIELPDGRRLGYFEYGDPYGVPAIYLHGSIDAGLFMMRQRLHGRGVRLIAVERGGVGESTPPENVSPTAYARDLKVLADTLDLRRYAVIGRSMGSWDAVTLAHDDAERVCFVALVSGRLPVADREEHELNGVHYKSLLQSVARSKVLGRLLLRAMLLQLRARGTAYFMSSRDAPAGERALVEDPLFQRHMKALWMRCANNGVEAARAHHALYEEPAEERVWEKLTMPVVLFHGLDDRNVPLERLLRQAGDMPIHSVKRYPQVGHRLVFLEMGNILENLRTLWDELVPMTDPN